MEASINWLLASHPLDFAMAGKPSFIVHFVEPFIKRFFCITTGKKHKVIVDKAHSNN